MSDVLEIDPNSFASGFSRRPFGLRHSLADHPLLSVDAIADLADELPKVERNRADLPLLLPGGAQQLEMRPSEVARGIEHNGCWMVLWNIEQRREYGELVDSCLDQVEPHTAGREGAMVRREAFLFLSAPGTTTPVHFDPEHNLLLQIRGTKEMNIGRFPDEPTEQREFARYYNGGHRNLECMPIGVSTFEMQPRDGVYVHPFAPHWVRNGTKVSVSLSVTWRTEVSQRTEKAHMLNSRLQRLGMSPALPGRSERLDRTKAALVTTQAKLRALRPKKNS